MSDADLLRCYLQDESADAFAALVHRHLDLVYSVARRKTGSASVAEEVAQSVFIELARNARRIKPGTPLVAWLHVVTRRIAINAVRDATRRHTREQHVAEIAHGALAESTAMKSDRSNWQEVEPLLDDAVESLSEPDRAAILLRYFENKTLREVGTALGASEDAAQKRVARAVEQLRAFFLRRGVSITAAGLATDLSAHALQIAPAGLGLAIANTAALSTMTATAVAVETSRALAMTTLQKTLVTTALVVVGGAGLYETLLAAREGDDLVALRTQTGRTTAELRSLRAEHDATQARLKMAEQQIDARIARARVANSADAALVAEMTNWFTRIDRIKQALAERPGANIPELKYLKEDSWFLMVGGRTLDSDEDLRRAMADIRWAAESSYSGRFSPALRAYVNAHDGTLPDSPLELAEYLDPPIERAILERYEMLATGKVLDLPLNKRRQVMGVKTPPDVEFDAYSLIGTDSHGSTTAVGVNMMGAVEAFARAHSGERPISAAQLKPYLRWPMSDDAVQKNLDLMARYPAKQ